MFSQKEEDNFGVGGKVVVALCRSIKNTSCKAVYFDNYFASPSLMSYLREEMGIFSLGTLRRNRTAAGTNSSGINIKKRKGTLKVLPKNKKKHK